MSPPSRLTLRPPSRLPDKLHVADSVVAVRHLPRPPYQSEEAADWYMYVDLLQDAGASVSVWRKALRIARSLEKNPHLLLLARYGSYSSPCWDIPFYPHAVYFNWLRPEWLRATAAGRNVLVRAEDWLGTSSRPGSAAMAEVIRMNPLTASRRFFEIHSLRHIPHSFRMSLLSF